MRIASGECARHSAIGTGGRTAASPGRSCPGRSWPGSVVACARATTLTGRGGAGGGLRTSREPRLGPSANLPPWEPLCHASHEMLYIVSRSKTFRELLALTPSFLMARVSGRRTVLRRLLEKHFPQDICIVEAESSPWAGRRGHPDSRLSFHLPVFDSCPRISAETAGQGS